MHHDLPPRRGYPIQCVRRPDLAPQTRLERVKLVWQSQGISGKMPEIAQQYQLSRTVLYPLLWMAN
jgi:hypothetical protein